MRPVIISIWKDEVNNLRFYLWQVGHYEYQFTGASPYFLPINVYQECLEDVEIDLLSQGYVKELS